MMKNELKALLDAMDQDEDEDPKDRIRELVHILINGLDETDRIIEEFKIRATQRDER
jgi:hypothetical protein